MKCQILHETKNRMRVHFCKENMTIEEADKADAYLKSISGIDDVTVYERTGDLIILLTGANWLKFLLTSALKMMKWKTLRLSAQQGLFSVNMKKSLLWQSLCAISEKYFILYL